jgi:hypothetical protein
MAATMQHGFVTGELQHPAFAELSVSVMQIYDEKFPQYLV